MIQLEYNVGEVESEKEKEEQRLLNYRYRKTKKKFNAKDNIEKKQTKSNARLRK